MTKSVLESSLYRNDLNKAIMSFDFSFLYGKTILITGGSGLIGSAIVDLLIELNSYSKKTISIFIADINEELYLNKYTSFSFITFIKYNALEEINFSIKFDFIIHCAGIASPNLYFEKPVETMLSNILGIKNLIDYGIKNGTKRLIYISSSEVYGIKENPEPFIENNYGTINNDNIRNCYAVAKKASEMLCNSYFKEFNLEIICVRPGHIFGPTASMNDKRISSDFCFKAARNEKMIMKSEGLQIRSYCYSVDCACSILFLLKNGKPGESYNIGSLKPMSIKDFAISVSKFSGVELSFDCPSNIEKLSFNVMDNSSLNSEKILNLGFSYSFSSTEAIEHTILIIKECL